MLHSGAVEKRNTLLAVLNQWSWFHYTTETLGRRHGNRGNEKLQRFHVENPLETLIMKSQRDGDCRINFVSSLVGGRTESI